MEAESAAWRCGEDDRREAKQREDVHSPNVSVPVWRPSHGSHASLHDIRRALEVSTHARLSSYTSNWLGCFWIACGECCERKRHSSKSLDGEEYRENEGAAASHELQLGLGESALPYRIWRVLLMGSRSSELVILASISIPRDFFSSSTNVSWHIRRNPWSTMIQ
jgi:hypothetical protein